MSISNQAFLRNTILQNPDARFPEIAALVQSDNRGMAVATIKTTMACVRASVSAMQGLGMLPALEVAEVVPVVEKPTKAKKVTAPKADAV